MPSTEKRARKAWAGKQPLKPVLEVADGFDEARGLLEAWSAPGPEAEG